MLSETSHAAPISKSEVGNCISGIKKGHSLETGVEQENRIIGFINAAATTSESLTEFVFSSTFSENYSKNVYAHEDIWEIPETLLEAIPADLLPSHNKLAQKREHEEENNIPTQIYGSPTLHIRLKKLLHHVFSQVLSKEPAQVTPSHTKADKITNTQKK